MAYINAVKPSFSLSGILTRPFVAVWNFLILLAEAHPKMTAINKLNAQSDAQLAERGTSREAEIRRIFSGQFYL
ncbi:hypothetical protein [Pseudorhodobacter ferrugineus]|uniref:hypothetical protein n=1 Tax=Pseudorhodobacter ferrugineus TaxID=77008 RepID=UPI0003B49965|nr:hypothetical protein [Pseudorhodobacter ferrugineus]